MDPNNPSKAPDSAEQEEAEAQAGVWAPSADEEPPSFGPSSLDSATAPPGEASPQTAATAPVLKGLGYQDLLYLVLFSIPAFIVSMVVCVVVFFGLKHFLGWEMELQDAGGKAAMIVAVQALWWILILAFMYGLIVVKYDLPFGPTIAWRAVDRRPVLYGAMYCGAGFFLACSVALVAQVIPMPAEKLPIEELLRDRSSLLLVAFFGVAIAPAIEELVFRGFVYTVVERAHGRLAAVVGTAGFFSIIHGQQYGWHWQNLLLLFYVGVVFGAVRAKTNSVVPATFIHAAYNTTLLMGVFSATEKLQGM